MSLQGTKCIQIVSDQLMTADQVWIDIHRSSAAVVLLLLLQSQITIRKRDKKNTLYLNQGLCYGKFGSQSLWKLFGNADLRFNYRKYKGASSENLHLWLQKALEGYLDRSHNKAHLGSCFLEVLFHVQLIQWPRLACWKDLRRGNVLTSYNQEAEN